MGKATKPFKMPHATLLYFAKSAYSTYFMRGNRGPFTNKTVHLNPEGNRRELVATVMPRHGKVIITYLDDRLADDGQRLFITAELPIRKAWSSL